MNVASFISLVLTGNGITQEDIPKEYSRKTIRRTNETDISEFMSSVMSARKTGNILVITKLESIAELIKAINSNLSFNRISVICNGIPDTSALEAEIEERSLHTEDGRMFVPEISMNYQDLIHADGRIIIKRKPYKNEQAVFNKNGKVVGVLLDDSIRYEDIKGIVADNINLLSITEKASLILETMKGDTSNIACFQDILLVRTGNRHSFIVLPSEKTQNICNAELQLFTGMTEKNTFGEIIKRLAKLSLPGVLAEDIDKIVTNFFISQNAQLPKHRLIKNTMERIILMEESA